MKHFDVHAAAFMEACLHLSEFPVHPVEPHDVDLFHPVATVKVPDQVSFGFAAPDADIDFVAELDHYNFREPARWAGCGRPGCRRWMKAARTSASACSITVTTESRSASR